MDRATSPRPSARPAAAAAAAAASASASAAAAAAAATSAMGASVTKCLGSQCEDLPAAPPRPAGPPPSARTFDLEELGLLAAPAAVRAAERSVEVAYEHENAAAIPHRDRRARRRPVADACTPDACAPLDKSAAASASASGRPRGRVVAAKEPSKPSADDADQLSTSATDNEEEDERCSKTHKLCMCELRRHRAADDCWLAAYGNVYDVTGILRAHPGGARSLLRKAGGPDCSSDMDFHTRKARRMMDHCFVGKLQPCGDDADAGQANCSIM